MSSAAERAALIARQGAGARWDAAEAPVDSLLLARRGTAYFARLLNGLRDEALVDCSSLPGRTRAHVIAHVGYHARGLARLVAAARTGAEGPVDKADIALAASLPARALRGLFAHAALHLDVEWRDLPGPAWDAPMQGRAGLTMRETPMIRARVIWQAALDLDAGGRARDIPEAAGLR